MDLKKIENKKYFEIRNAMETKMEQTAIRGNLSKEEMDFLVEINSRTLYGLYKICEREHVPFDLENKLECFDFYDFEYIQSDRVSSIQAENYRYDKDGKLSRNIDTVRFIYPEFMSKENVVDLIKEDSEETLRLAKILVHENLHFLDSFVKDGQYETTLFEHEKLDGFNIRIIKEIETEDISTMVFKEFVSDINPQNLLDMDTKKEVIENIDGDEIKAFYVKPTVGMGYSYATGNTHILKMGGLSEYLDSYINLNTNFYNQFYVNDSKLIERFETNMKDTEKSLRRLFENLDKEEKIKEFSNLRNVYSEGTEIIIEMFESKIQYRENFQKKYLEDSLKNSPKVLSAPQIEKQVKEGIDNSRRDSFDSYLNQSIQLIDTSVRFEYQDKIVLPIEESMSKLDLKLYGKFFNAETEEDFSKINDSFREVRDMKRENPGKAISFNEFVDVCESKGLKGDRVEMDDEKVLVEPHLEKLYEYQKQMSMDRELSF